MISASQISNLLNGDLYGDPDAMISGPSKIEEGQANTISFLGNLKYEEHLYTTAASVVLVNKSFTPSREVKCTLIKVDDVYQSLTTLLEFYNSQKVHPKTTSDRAVISDKAQVSESACIAANSVVDEYAHIGDHTIIYPLCFIGAHVKIGKKVVIYPGVKIYHNTVIEDNVVIHGNTVIGSDGFGFSKDDKGNYIKIPQIGNVIIESNVEIGANVVIDRASMGSTVIKSGVKLDNLIQIGHNVVVDQDTVIAAQTGIAGSTRIGKNCMIGGQVGLAGHINIADGTMIQAKSGLSSDVKESNTKLYGYPALDYSNYLKSYAHFKNLPDLVKKINELESQISKLKKP